MLIYLIIVKTKFTPPVFPNTILLHILLTCELDFMFARGQYTRTSVTTLKFILDSTFILDSFEFLIHATCNAPHMP